MELRRARGLPRVARKVRRHDLRREVAAHPHHRRDIEPQMHISVRFEIRRAQPQEPHRRTQPRRVFRMRWMEVLLLQMHKGPGHLDQPLEVEMITPFRPQPQMLEHIMRFVVLPRIEAREIAQILRRQPTLRVSAEGLDESGYTVSFFYRARAQRETNLPAFCA